MGRSLEALERKRASDNRITRRPKWIERAQGADEEWVVLCCEKCFGFFDVPREGREKNMRKQCEECRWRKGKAA